MDEDLSYILSPTKSPYVKFYTCSYCKANAFPNPIGHNNKSCPELMKLSPCAYCKATGTENHTPTHCPMRPRRVLKPREWTFDISPYFQDDEDYEMSSLNSRNLFSPAVPSAANSAYHTQVTMFGPFGTPSRSHQVADAELHFGANGHHLTPCSDRSTNWSDVFSYPPSPWSPMEIEKQQQTTTNFDVWQNLNGFTQTGTMISPEEAAKPFMLSQVLSRGNKNRACRRLFEEA